MYNAVIVISPDRPQLPLLAVWQGATASALVLLRGVPEAATAVVITTVDGGGNAVRWAASRADGATDWTCWLSPPLAAGRGRYRVDYTVSGRVIWAGCGEYAADTQPGDPPGINVIGSLTCAGIIALDDPDDGDAYCALDSGTIDGVAVTAGDIVAYGEADDAWYIAMPGDQAIATQAWVLANQAGAAVSSVNGKVGAVVLTASDIVNAAQTNAANTFSAAQTFSGGQLIDGSAEIDFGVWVNDTRATKYVLALDGQTNTLRVINYAANAVYAFPSGATGGTILTTGTAYISGGTVTIGGASITPLPVELDDVYSFVWGDDLGGDGIGVAVPDSGGETALYIFAPPGVAPPRGVAVQENLPYPIEEVAAVAGVYQLKDRTINWYANQTQAATINVDLPAEQLAAGLGRDLYFDIDNSGNSSALGVEFAGLGTDYGLVCADGDTLAEVTEVAAGDRARLLVTETSFTATVGQDEVPVFQVAQIALGAIEMGS